MSIPADFSYDFYEGGEALLLDKLKKLSKPLSVIFDVGANTGTWAEMTHVRHPGAIVHCFELSYKTFQNLKRAISGPSFVLNNVGLSNKVGEIEYKDYGENCGVNTMVLRSTFHDASVKPNLVKADVITGKDYCKSNNIPLIDFLKIDVEGAENLVLEGFAPLLKDKSIRIIQFEYGYNNGDFRYLMRDFYEFFAQYGYVVGRIHNGPIVFRDWMYSDNDFMSGPNYIAVHKNDLEVIDLLK